MAASSLSFAALAPEYTGLWSTMTINPTDVGKVAQAANTLRSLKVKFYDPVTTDTGVPWYVIGLIHSLECGFDVHQNLSNGDPLGKQTTSEPPGRPPSPPFDWLHCSDDALKTKGLADVKDWSIERIAYSLEAYNGWGYRKFHPSVLTPYLWGCTNHYTRGKYIADHKFSATAASDQVGAMALLRRLIDDGLTVAAQGPVVLPPPPPPPVPTGQFEVDGHPFVLRDAAGAPARPDGIPVMRNMPVEKLAEVGDGTWWNVRVESPGGSKDDGFAMKTWLRPVFAPVVIDERSFAQACLDAARHYGTNAHFLIALADAETGVTNRAADSGAFGPFALTKEDWATYNDPKETGSGDGDRFVPYEQPAVAARMTAKFAEAMRPGLPDNALPTAEQLYLARIFGAQNVKLLQDAAPSAILRAVLQPSPPVAAAAVPPAAAPAAPAAAPPAAASAAAPPAAAPAAASAAAPPAAAPAVASAVGPPAAAPAAASAAGPPAAAPAAPAAPTGMSLADLQAAIKARSTLLRVDMTIGELHTAVETKLDASLAKAVDWILKAEPDLVLGPPQAVATADVPWMDAAKAELGVTAANNPARITQYFAATTAGPLPASEPWCAAFVSFCIKQAGGSPKVKVFSALAADWLGNGDPLPGPQFGAVAVTVPLVKGDSGHVGFVSAWDERSVTFLGGNQSHSVCEKKFKIGDVRGWRMV